MAWKNSYPQNMGKKRRTKKNFTRSIQSLFNSCSKAWFHCFKWLFWATWNCWCEEIFLIHNILSVGAPQHHCDYSITLFNQWNKFIYFIAVMQYFYICYIKCRHGFLHSRPRTTGGWVRKVVQGLLWIFIHVNLWDISSLVRGSLPARVTGSLHMKEWNEWSGLHFLHNFDWLSLQVFILGQCSKRNLSLTQMTICYPLQQQQQ